MKLIASITAMLALAFTINQPAARADSFGVSLKTGAVADVLLNTPIFNGNIFTYTNTTIGALGAFGAVLSESTSLFTATYTDIAGVGLLNVTDVCTHVTIIGPETPCQAFAFSFTNLTLDNAQVLAALGVVDVSASANVANFNVASASIAGGAGSFSFGNPPPAATPEPGSLALLGTGVLSAAGAFRRKILATA